jgi:two-component system nitrate/nitrite response regulator NarL
MSESVPRDESFGVVYALGPSALDRAALRLLLSERMGVLTGVESGFAPTAVWTAVRSGPDLVIVDADAPQTEVVDAMQMIVRLRPRIRTLLLSAAVEPAVVESWAVCTLQGYVVKDGGVEELRAALAALRDGREYFSEGIRLALARGATRRNGAARLSRREAELLPLLARGMTLRDAAARMTISYKTADSYRTSLLRKLGVRDRVELARYAIRQHIIEP